MSIRVTHSVFIQASRDSEGKRKLLWGDEVSDAVSLETLDKIATSVVTVNPSGIETLGFGDVSDARGIYLEVDGPCLVRLNGGVQSIPVAPAPEASVGKLFLEGAITGVQVQNTSTTAVLSGLFAVWGDPTA